MVDLGVWWVAAHALCATGMLSVCADVKIGLLGALRQKPSSNKLLLEARTLSLLTPYL